MANTDNATAERPAKPEADDQELTPTESRQAVTGRHVSTVLVVSLTLAVFVGLIFLALFVWNALP